MVDALCKPARVKLQFDNLRAPRCMLAWRETSLALSGFQCRTNNGIFGKRLPPQADAELSSSPFRTFRLDYSTDPGGRAGFYLFRGSFGLAAFFGHAHLAFSLG